MWHHFYWLPPQRGAPLVPQFGRPPTSAELICKTVVDQDRSESCLPLTSPSVSQMTCVQRKIGGSSHKGTILAGAVVRHQVPHDLPLLCAEDVLCNHLYSRGIQTAGKLYCCGSPEVVLSGFNVFASVVYPLAQRIHHYHDAIVHRLRSNP